MEVQKNDIRRIVFDIPAAANNKTRTIVGKARMASTDNMMA